MKVIESTGRNWLLTEFNRKRIKNPYYSLRRMAQQLGLQPGRLSEFLSGKRPITLKMAEKICEKMALKPEDKRDFLTCVKKDRLSHDNLEASSLQQRKYVELSSDHFHVIADWYHFAILSLMDLDEFVNTSDWISARLGISKIQVKGALDRLQRLNLIKINNQKKWIKTHDNLTTTQDIESAALKHSHKQTFEQLIELIDDIPVSERDMTSMTMAIDKSKLSEAKRLIKEFRRKLCDFMETGNRTEVYNLNIQLYPISKIIERRRK